MINRNVNSFLKLLRAHHSLKNLLIFSPFIFYFNQLIIIEFLIIFFFFSLTCFGTYIFNDLIDYESDKKHPLKKHRTLPSGEISKKAAVFILFALLIIPTLFFFYFEKKILVFNFIYIACSLSYSLFIKNYKYFDILLISTLYPLRCLIGFETANIQYTLYFILFIFFTALKIILIKRFTEIIKNKESLSLYKSEKELKILFFLFLVANNILLLLFHFTSNFDEIFVSHLGFFLIQIFYSIFFIIWYRNLINLRSEYDTVLYIFSKHINLIIFFITLIIFIFSRKA